MQQRAGWSSSREGRRVLYKILLATDGSEYARRAVEQTLWSLEETLLSKSSTRPIMESSDMIIMGSVSQRVLHEAKCPVLIVK